MGKKTLINVVIPLARDTLPGFISNLASNAINKFERKRNGKGAVRAGKGFTQFMSIEDVNDIITNIKSFEDSNKLIDGIIETVKHEIKITERQFPSCLVSTFSHFISAISDFFSSKRYNWRRN